MPLLPKNPALSCKIYKSQCRMQFRRPDYPARLSMKIATFLIVRGIVRITLAHALRLPHTFATSLGGLLSNIMGFLIWKEWPTSDGWFISLCLNAEIAVRGWAMMTFALWVRTQKMDEIA